MDIKVNLENRSYSITVKRGALQNIGEIFNLDRKVLIVTDDGVPKEYSSFIAAQSKNATVVSVKQGEDSKCFDNLKMLCSVMLKNNFTRKDCVVAVGGGVVGDLAGFAAASYMRGVDFYNFPTTVLSQVDSSVGGKVAVNLDGVKNIVGAFYQPKAVVIDPDVLKTLPARQISNGLAEAIKIGLTSDKSLFELFENGDYKDNIDLIIEKSITAKKNVVQQDEKESNLRKILNFGHTVGHAIEGLNLGKLYHGECVALGMTFMCSEDVKKRLLEVLKKVNLPTSIQYEKQDILSFLYHDKKADNGKISAIFVEEIGEYIIKDIKTEDFLKLI